MPRGVPGSADRACATRASGPARSVPREVRIRSAQPVLAAPTQHIRRSRAREGCPPVSSELHAGVARKRGSGVAIRTPTRGAAPAAAGRPARGTAIRMPCRHASPSAAGRATRRKPPWAREFPEILRSHRRHPGNRSERKPPQPSWHTGRRQPRHSRPGASARLSAAREAGMGSPRTLSVAVRGIADGAHRPS